MKRAIKKIGSFSLICCIFFAVDSRSVQANEEKYTFFDGYEAYLKKDFHKALSFWKPLAEAGHSDAQYKLGIMYLNGQGVRTDLSQAFKWFLASGEQGDAGAQYLAGEMYLKGKGVEQDFERAGIWFKRAAEQDYPDAQYRLGEWYATGKGSDQELKLAYVWLKLAGVNGIQPSDEIRGRVEKKLRPKSLEEAKGLAFEWWIKLKNR